MLEAAHEALLFADGKHREHLDTDRMLVLSLVKLIEIIGEAATGLSNEYRQAHPHIPWRDLVAMRNRLIHAYFDVNLDIVWRTVTEELPRLCKDLEEALVVGE
ncbi:MAG: DUF86 domain-containing protein [Deinococcota bacterium]|jgi:uncharacterized protein with HEPN domain|nr:DUF86 domain-containing protein [Deinococcota bacterium]